ncbi:MAG TPA: SMP-30/gluconolactonase/LRE family protein, partial [Planctomycetaceae bacterium]|nr:SMP-30/gluconolactonase/LRE family protein [Planctomycetaceae bacterium]
DSERDFISDRGDEVWNVLESRGIRNVILTGVHVNMCVLGRPFGLRQMARNGKNVVLMRDMTDTMYNPKSWPYVSHFEGTFRIIAHIERFVCPTITSDQIIGGKPFRFRGDDTSRETTDRTGPIASEFTLKDFQTRWVTIDVPSTWKTASKGVLNRYQGPGWYRCVVKIPGEWSERDQLELSLDQPVEGERVKAWINGHVLQPQSIKSLAIPSKHVNPDDHNLIVIRVENDSNQVLKPPVLNVLKTDSELILAGRWQFRIGDDPAWTNMVLPSKFGGAADIVFAPEDPPFVTRTLTRPFEFTAGIEGPACDREGNVYAVNFARQGTIGRVTPDGIGEIFVELPEGSLGNGIRFNRAGIMFVADYPLHNILRIDPETREITTLAHHDEMNQPNDIAIAADGTLYASDPNWTDSTGQLWRIDPDGTTTKLAAEMGTTNGIEVSPDGRTLYVNESVQRNIWAFAIHDDKTFGSKRLLKKFEDHGFDGMRCDVDGNLYVTRYGKGTVVKLSPEGEILQEIDVLGMRPSNLCFGGPDGRTVYVTEVEYQRLVQFRVDRPGLEWQRWNEPK